MRLRPAPTHLNVPGRHGPHGELFFFLLKKKPAVISELVEFGPCISAETVKACALIGLLGSDFSPDLREIYGETGVPRVRNGSAQARQASLSECHWWNCHSSKALFSPWTGCDNKRKNLVRDMKEKERVRRAPLRCGGSPVSFAFLVVDVVCLWRKGTPSFLRAALWLQ